MFRLSLNKVDALFSALAGRRPLYLPVDDGKGTASFQSWKPGTVMSRALNTLRSAKDFFFPQTENLMDFKMKGKTIELVDTRSDAEDFVLFGVRACDAAGFAVLDRVFLADPVDTYYQSRRSHGVVITAACHSPRETCFCRTFGITPDAPGGDVMTWQKDGFLYWEPVTEKGRLLSDSVASLFEDADEKDTCAVEEEKARIRAALDRLPLASLTTKGFGGDKTKVLFDDPKWKELASACLGCGICTYLCPTCQCYDIRDFDTGHGIKRFRCWDSCMYAEFTKMSAGQPRLTQTERFRQRFMHKLVYFPENQDGVFGCVGCGRCVRNCPVSRHIVNVMKDLGGDVRE